MIGYDIEDRNNFIKEMPMTFLKVPCYFKNIHLRAFNLSKKGMYEELEDYFSSLDQGDLDYYIFNFSQNGK